MKKNVMMMAFGGGQDTTVDSGSPKLYTGKGICNVIAVNPSKSQLEEIYSRTIENDPQYTSTDSEGKATVRLDFIVKFNEERNNGINAISKIAFFLKKTPQYNNAGTKVQVVNKYGEFAFIEEALAKKGEIPENMAWFTGPYRPAYIGEENLTRFLKTFLGIPARSFRDANGKVHELENPELAEAQLESINNYFSGNIKEISDIISKQPDNLITMIFGVKHGDGRDYQDVFIKDFARGNAKNTSRLVKSLEDAKSNGAYPNTDFTTDSLKEYSVEPTKFEEDKSSKNDGAMDMEAFF